MKAKVHFFTALFFLIFIPARAGALSLFDDNTLISDFFYSTLDSNEGTTSFRSLLIPFGGRTESLGNAYTGLCDDINYLRYNPAAGALQKEGQIALFHNSWIADSKLDTLAFTTRFNKIPSLSFGTFLSCFYLPFTEYNAFGDRVTSGYYSETTGAFNISYNFFEGYDFKGLALGATVKASWRSIPNYADDDTGLVIPNSGISQSAAAFMADIGMMMQFNFLKFYSSRDPNVRIGLSLQNLGAAVTGFTKTLVQDSPLPTLASAGISVRFIKPFTLSLDFSQPLNLQDLKTYHLPYISTGISVQFAPFLLFLAGAGIKGSNPHINAGFEFEVAKIRLNLNYTLDFTSSLAPFNKFSLSAKIMLGDKGRSITAAKIDELYSEGLMFYAEEKWEEAIECWEKVLKLNRHFNPASLGIKAARYRIEMLEMIKNSLKLDQD
ncbi:MAG: UPF0164 family protein [Treponema sp.]|nr:UPF0164 family protein [Treponema sp.]